MALAVLAPLAACGSGGNNGTPDAAHVGQDGNPVLGDGGGNDAPVVHDSGPPNGVKAIPLTSDQGFAYMALTTIGGQGPFALDLDTGSTTLGVAGASCTSCMVTPEYAPGAGAMDQSSTSSATYGDMTGWNAENYSDQVEISGDMPVTMRFANIESQNGFFGRITDQGIIGFGPAGAALSGTDSFVAQRPTSEFALQLCPDSGTLWLDGYDPAHTQSAPQYTPMQTNGVYYQMTVSAASVGGTSIALTGHAIPDSGTTAIVVGSSAGVTALENAVTSSSGYQQIFGSQSIESELDPGSNTRAQIDAALPPLEFTLPGAGGGTITLSLPASQSYLLDDGTGYQFTVEADSSLSQGTGGQVDIIFGDMFMRQFVTVFDVADGKAGFAPQTGCSLPPAGPRKQSPWYRNGHPIHK